MPMVGVADGGVVRRLTPNSANTSGTPVSLRTLWCARFSEKGARGGGGINYELVGARIGARAGVEWDMGWWQCRGKRFAKTKKRHAEPQRG
jgi:hypothetical protein